MPAAKLYFAQSHHSVFFVQLEIDDRSWRLDQPPQDPSGLRRRARHSQCGDVREHRPEIALAHLTILRNQTIITSIYLFASSTVYLV